MPLPNIESFTGALDRACRDGLGEVVLFDATGSGTYEGVRGHVVYRDGVQALQIAEVVAQDITVAFLKADVAAKPAASARIILSKHPGRLFRPINVRTDDAGTEWNFDLKDVPDA